MDKNEQILNVVKSKGPILPVDVSKEVNDTLLLTAARMSELLSAKQLKISTVKIGGSPVYYVSGQEQKLQDFSSYLHEKEQEAYSLLQSQEILADDQQEPAIRVALRTIKDFAVPLEVVFNNHKKIFWKWYLLSPEKVQEKIKELLTTRPSQEARSEIRPTQEKTKEQHQTQQQNIQESKTQLNTTQKTLDNKEKTIEKKQPPARSQVDPFQKAKKYFSSKKIELIEEHEMKGKERNYIISVDSTIGKLQYFCKFKDKKRINDADLSSALVQAQNAGYPLLFLTTGDLTKKTEELLSKDFKNILVKKI